MAKPLEMRKQEDQIYAYPGFFMSMRSKFVAEGVHLLLLGEFGNPLLAHWKIFDAKLLGPTDPEAAPTDSLRGAVLTQWEELGSIRFGVSVNSSRAMQ